MKTCDPSITPSCPGHESWENLSDCLTAALYGCTHDDSTGTVDGFGVWVGLVCQDLAETLDPEMPDGVGVTIPAGTYCLIIETKSGSVTRLDYDTAEQAQAAFDLWEQQYEAYCEQVEYRENRITSSTGRVGR